MTSRFYAGGKPIEPPMRPNNRYERVFVILQDGKTRLYENAGIYLFDNQLSVVAKEGKAIFNFNNIVGAQCYYNEENT